MLARIDQVGRAFALLVGVNDYRAYDTSRGLPAGTNDLPAGRNDVGAFYRMCRALGVPPENIHILTSPKLQPGDVGEPGEKIPCGHLGEATGAEIRDQLAWLADALSHAPGDPDGPIGLFTYSGHGDFAAGHLALCPTDVRAPSGGPPLAAPGAASDLEGALGFPEIQAIFQSHPGRGDNLTVVLDCCHAAAAQGVPKASPMASPMAPLKRRRGVSLTGRGRSSGAGSAPVQLFGGRMVMAAAPGELAYQSKFDGHDHGALTWALNVVTDQWLVQSEGDVDNFTIDHGTLLGRSQQILRALGFAQTLALYPETASKILFFHRGAADAGDVAATAPDRARHGIQINPDWKPDGWPTNEPGPDWVLYTFSDAKSATLGAVLAVKNGTTTFKYGVARQEYWSVDPATIDKATTLTATAGRWSDAAPAFPVTGVTSWYQMSVDPGTWTNGEAPSGSTTRLYGTCSEKSVFAFEIVNDDKGAPASWKWHQGWIKDASAPAYAVSGSATLMASTSPPSSAGWPVIASWQHVSVSVIATGT